jgi:hypothetical protein
VLGQFAQQAADAPLEVVVEHVTDHHHAAAHPLAHAAELRVAELCLAETTGLQCRVSSAPCVTTEPMTGCDLFYAHGISCRKVKNVWASG